MPLGKYDDQFRVDLGPQYLFIVFNPLLLQIASLDFSGWHLILNYFFLFYIFSQVNQ